MTRRQFDEWVEKMVEKYKSEKFWSACETRTVKDVVICVDRNHNVGIAKCHPDDEFNPFIGTAIAYARMRGFEVPKVTIYKKLSEMKNGERFVDVVGDTFRYVAKDRDVFVVWSYEDKKYWAMPFDVEYEMVD